MKARDSDDLERNVVMMGRVIGKAGATARDAAAGLVQLERYREAEAVTDRVALMLAMILTPTDEELAAMAAGAHPPYLESND